MIRILARTTLLGLILGFMIMGALPAGAVRAPIPLTPEEAVAKRHLLALVTREDEAVLKGDESALRALFSDSPSARAAFHHAKARMAFLASWARVRGVRFHDVSVTLRTPGVRFLGGGRMRFFAVVSEAFTLSGRGRDATPVVFGIGVRHVFVTETRDGKWTLLSDDFTDPLDQDTRIPGEALPAEVPRRLRLTRGPSPALLAGPGAGVATGRQRAVDYAESYCGAAPGCGNGRRYNPRYNDYNGDGGDCTNFSSQVLRAGGFRENGVWSYDAGRGEGSRAWSNAGALFDFLTWSGRAKVLASGSYEDLTKPRPGAPFGIVYTLEPGDLIGYREKSRLVHFAVVVGTSPLGYPVVDSHTADRHQVPWDIGWDRRTTYNLLRVRYPGALERPRSGPRTP